MRLMTLKAFLGQPGETCARLGAKVEMSASSISRLANGTQNITLAQARRIEAATGGLVTVAELSVPEVA